MNALKQNWKLLILIAAITALSGCTDSEASKKLLESQGMTDVKITGYSVFSCSKDDTFATGFTAKTQNGTQVTGTVCSGLLFKGATIRYN